MSREKNQSSSNFNINNFIGEESIGGIILILVTIIALAWANSPYYASYKYLWYELEMGFSIGSFELKSNLHHWINDGLMAVFFFTIGLEIGREVLAGELSSMKKASLPLGAALGGMIVPAIIYVFFNYDNPDYVDGWGIPMATDIAFALGIMTLLGKRIPLSLKVFITAVAIADDLGAIMIIAIFYTESINTVELLNAAIFLTILIAANRLGVRRTTFYAIVGFLGVWLSFLFSGVHATIAGVLIALTIPVRTKISEDKYINEIYRLIGKFKSAKSSPTPLLTEKQAHLISDIERLSADAHTPLQKLEHALHPVTAYAILPIFALSNAGVRLDGSFVDMLFHPISIGIILGLVLGKALGVSLFSRMMVWLKISTLPEGVRWRHIYGVGFFAGIGFTMSMFISGLAFVPEKFEQIAKVGILTASMLSAIIGVLILMSLKVEHPESD